MIKITIATTLLSLSMFNAVSEFQKDFPIPIQIKDQQIEDVQKTLFILGRDQKYLFPIVNSAKSNGIDPTLWACIVETESEYNMTAKSSMGYKGLAQTPQAVMKTGFITADLTYGTCTLKEKLIISKGDMLKAITFYKGSKELYDAKGKKTKGHEQALEALALYKRVKSKLQG
jgi:hypothetical protein